jgi:hypothetical protein
VNDRFAQAVPDTLSGTVGTRRILANEACPHRQIAEVAGDPTGCNSTATAKHTLQQATPSSKKPLVVRPIGQFN